MAKQNWETVRNDYERITADLYVYSVEKDGEHVARIVVKYGGRRSPNGLTVRAFVHVLGLPMVRGIARGGGYDMKSAAIVDAVQHLKPVGNLDTVDAYALPQWTARRNFRNLKDNGHDIPHQLRAMGYTVNEVV